jgi:hypothetical protein
MLALLPPDLFNLGAAILISSNPKVRPFAMQVSADCWAFVELILLAL